MLDNGQQITFVDGKVESVSQAVEVEEVYVDGKDFLDSSGLVIRDREILGTDGSIVVGIVIDHKTKEIIGGPDVQSRGVIYLKDADYVVKECGEYHCESLRHTVNAYDGVARAID